jgi:hypothetical protein
LITRDGEVHKRTKQYKRPSSRLQCRWYSHSHKFSLTLSHDTTEPNGTRDNVGHKQCNKFIISNDNSK